MRGILATGVHVPHHRLDTGEVAAFFGRGGGRGTRAVASFDEDTTSMGVEAARAALADADGVRPEQVWFATARPAYHDKSNAATVCAATRLVPDVAALDLGGALRNGAGALRAALTGRGRTLVVSADIRVGRPTSPEEATGGDAAAAVLVGDDADGTLVAEHLGSAAVTDEFLERWTLPGETTSRTWEERFGETVYGPLVDAAWSAALADAGVDAAAVDKVVVAGMHTRAVRRARSRLGVADTALVDDLTAEIGNPGTAQAGLLLAHLLDGARPGEVLALVSLADGVEVVVVRATGAVADRRPSRPLAAQIAAGGPVSYARFLSWRDQVTVEPPNRPAPARPSASAAYRRRDWKYGFVASRDRTSGMLHLPPARVSEKGGAVDDMEPVPMADTAGTIVSLTVDRLVYSPSPPVLFPVVDFDGGGRAPLELTDATPGEVGVGDRVEPTFRRLYTADGIHNYFWKVRPVRFGPHLDRDPAHAPDVAGATGEVR